MVIAKMCWHARLQTCGARKWCVLSRKISEGTFTASSWNHRAQQIRGARNMLRRRLVSQRRLYWNAWFEYYKVVETYVLQKRHSCRHITGHEWSDKILLLGYKSTGLLRPFNEWSVHRQQDRFFAVRKQESVGTNAGF